MSFQEKTAAILTREKEIESRLSGVSDPKEIAKLSKELSDLREVCGLIRDYQAILTDKASLMDLLSDSDLAISQMAEEELPAINVASLELEKAIRISLSPRDVTDEKDALIEIRAGTGGEEAALFAGTLLRMYLGYAEARSWRSEILSASDSDLGGYKEVIARITGNDVYFRLRFESGVHRVQRVPATESSGRIHTSAATVAVLPEAGEIDAAISPSDLRIDTMRAGGAGGQHVNKTESAVRITHEPTGISVVVQDERSQHKNKAKALSILRTRLYDLERARQGNDRAADRKGQVGSGDRSERIRTYNFPQGRVTDHRIGLTLYKLDKILTGEALDEIIEALIIERQAQLLASGA